MHNVSDISAATSIDTSSLQAFTFSFLLFKLFLFFLPSFTSFSFSENAKIWVGQKTINRERKGNALGKKHTRLSNGPW